VLPKIDGFTLLTRIKADNEVKNIPVIVLTNLSDAIDKCSKMGAEVYLIKSNESMESIKEKVKEILGQRKDK
jgi:two-component system chemotaxis sensor kinase CheA